MNQRDWIQWAFGQGCRAAINTQINGQPDTRPGPDEGSPNYRTWWWRGYYYQLYLIEHPQKAELSQGPKPEPETTVIGGACVSGGIVTGGDA